MYKLLKCVCLAVWAIVVLVGCSRGCEFVPDDGCAEPVRSPQITINDYADSVYSQTKSLLPVSRDENNLYSTPTSLTQVKREHFSGFHNCSEVQKSFGKRAKSNKHKKRSIDQIVLCPWKFVKNIDPNRKPEVIMEAECACSFPRSGDPGLFCENVYHFVTVFRRAGCEDGEYKYEKSVEKVPVACVTAAAPSLATAASRRKNIPVMDTK